MRSGRQIAKVKLTTAINDAAIDIVQPDGRPGQSLDPQAASKADERCHDVKGLSVNQRQILFKTPFTRL